MSAIEYYHYANAIVSILKQEKTQTLPDLKCRIAALGDDYKDEEKLGACLDDLVSDGTLICRQERCDDEPVESYRLRYVRNHNASNTNVDSGDGKEQAISDIVTTPQQQDVKPEYIIDPEFQSLLGTKTSEQYEALKKVIRRDEEVRDQLVGWLETSILVDGHTRHQIYEELREELGEKFRIKPPGIYWLSFEDREHAKMWVLENQLDRRNLKTFQQIEVALKLKEFYTAKAKENQRAGVSLNLGKGINTNKEVAKRADVSHDTVRKVERILEKAGNKEVAEAINALRRDDTGFSIDGVYQQYCGNRESSSKKKTSDKTKPAPSTPTPAEESETSPLFGTPSDAGKATPEQTSSVRESKNNGIQEIKEPSLHAMNCIENHLDEIKKILLQVDHRKEHRYFIYHMVQVWLNLERTHEKQRD